MTGSRELIRGSYVLRQIAILLLGFPKSPQDFPPPTSLRGNTHWRPISVHSAVPLYPRLATL